MCCIRLTPQTHLHQKNLYLLSGVHHDLNAFDYFTQGISYMENYDRVLSAPHATLTLSCVRLTLRHLPYSLCCVVLCCLIERGHARSRALLRRRV
jgi:hypothetical protein